MKERSVKISKYVESDFCHPTNILSIFVATICAFLIVALSQVNFSHAHPNAEQPITDLNYLAGLSGFIAACIINLIQHLRKKKIDSFYRAFLIQFLAVFLAYSIFIMPDLFSCISFSNLNNFGLCLLTPILYFAFGFIISLPALLIATILYKTLKYFLRIG